MYKCHYEDVAWLSERGPDWHIRGNDPIFIKGELPSGEKFVAEPIDTRVWDALPKYRCTDSEVLIDSEVFVEDINDKENLKSFDTIRTNLNGHIVKIQKSSFTLESVSKEKFKEPSDYDKPKDAGNSYYSINAMFIQGRDIDRNGLREYVSNRKSIWFGTGAFLPFTRWTNEDAEFARKNSQSYLYYPFGGIYVSADYIDKIWRFGSASSKNAITWRRSYVIDSDLYKVVDSDLPKDNVIFDGRVIQVPTARYLGIHRYDENIDCLVVFYDNRARVPSLD